MGRLLENMKSCFIRLHDDTLTAGNALFSREWKIRDTGLEATALHVQGKSWLCAAGSVGTIPPFLPLAAGFQPESPSARLELEEGPDGPIEAASLRGRLTLGRHVLHLKIFPGIAAITLRVDGPAGVSLLDQTGNAATGIESDEAAAEADPEFDLCERLHIPFDHPYLSIVHFFDQTDHHDNLVHEERLKLFHSETIRARGNLFLIEDGVNQRGVILLKWAPLPYARPDKYTYDVKAKGRDIILQGHSIGSTSRGAPWSLLAYQGGRQGATQALHQIQRAMRPYIAGRDGLSASNTWGDRSRDGRVSESFVISEITRASQLGIQVVQVDSGWEKGITSNSVNRAQGGVWEGFWANDPHFWDVNPERFPRGLQPVVDAAQKAGVNLGFWFAPDSTNDFQNWEKDAARILQFYRDFKVRYIKIDAVKIRSDLGASRLRHFFRQIQNETGGEMTLDLDVTAELRPGYFGAPDVGPLFIENRYTDWVCYWPHAILRNLRQLATWIDPLRLRMEFLNLRRNDAKYGTDPLRPMLWTMDAAAAITLVSSPLASCELGYLNEEDARALAGLLAAWQIHQDKMRQAQVYPWGGDSAETDWSGFRLVGESEEWILAFRVGSAQERCYLHDVAATSIHTLYGEGRGHMTDHGLEISVPEKFGYAFLHLKI